MLRAKLSVVPALVLGAAALLAACSSTPDDKTASWSPNKIYAEAKDEMNAGCVRQGDPAVRKARRPCRRHAAGAAGPAGKGLRPVQGRRPGPGAGHARPLHEAAPGQPGDRLRALPQGHRQLQRQPGHVRVPVAPGPVGARPEGRQGIVRGLQGTGHPLSRFALHARCPRAHDLHRQFAGPVRSARGALLLPAAAPTSPPSTARRTR